MKDLAPGVQELAKVVESRKPWCHKINEVEVQPDGEGFKAAHASYPKVLGIGATAQEAIDDWWYQLGTTWHPARLQYVYDAIKQANEAWLKSCQNSARGEVAAGIMEVEAFIRAFQMGEFQ